MGSASTPGLQVTREPSKAHALHGSCASLIKNHLLALFPEAAQKTLWAGGLDVPITVSLVLVVQATAVDGAIAFPVKGLPFVGGIDHCNWAAY
jgi:hypothetical protein